MRPLCSHAGAESTPHLLSMRSMESVAEYSLLLIDPEQVTRESLISLLATRCARISAYAAESTDGVLELPEADIILLDIKSARIECPEVVRTIASLRARAAHTPVVLISDCSRPGLAVAALALEISGCVPNSLGVEVVEAAIRLVLLGGTFFPRESICGAAPSEPVAEPIGEAGLPRRLVGLLSHQRFAVYIKPGECLLAACTTILADH